MSGAKVRKMNLPDAPKPTKPYKYVDPREKERQQRLAEHKNLSPNLVGIRDGKPLCFWDKARKAKLKRLWEEGENVKTIAREVGCSESICRDRIRYEIKCGRLEKRRKEVTDEQIQSIVSRYKAGMSLNNIAKEMLMSRYQVTTILKEQGEKQ